jgi:hypothetical protein
MEHAGFRTYKSVKNINRLFNNIDMDKYKGNQELESYLWCIQFISKQWLDGIVDINLIVEGAKHSQDYDNIKESIILTSMSDSDVISAPEAKMIFDLVGEALQYGYITSLKDKYISLLDDIDLNQPGAFRNLVNRLFSISQSLLDIKHNTSLIGNKVTFNTSDLDSVKEAVSETISSLKTNNNIFKTGIRRLNTLLSPGYMNGRVYLYLGVTGSFKSGMLLKSALDIRKYNPDFKSKTPGMKPCVLFITMENSFTETIERIWNMSFDDSITNYTEDEAIEKISERLGVIREVDDKLDNDSNDLLSKLNNLDEHYKNSNIEIVIKYFSYREISTDDIFTIIQDLKEDNLEVCCFILDYVKRIRPSTAIVDDVRLELNRIINELKALAVMYDIPVITAQQMNRVASSIVDSAIRQGKGDVTKLVGREHIGDSWNLLETCDWAAVLNIEYKQNSDDKYLVINVVKRRRIDSNESSFAKYTYLAHPFSKNNGLRLVDDFDLDKVLSLQSLVTDISDVNKEKTNATNRLKVLPSSEFIELDDEY